MHRPTWNIRVQTSERDNTPGISYFTVPSSFRRHEKKKKNRHSMALKTATHLSTQSQQVTEPETQSIKGMRHGAEIHESTNGHVMWKIRVISLNTEFVTRSQVMLSHSY